MRRETKRHTRDITEAAFSVFRIQDHDVYIQPLFRLFLHQVVKVKKLRRCSISEIRAVRLERFTGKINTNKSFPNPPEASHLLGQSVEGERPVESQRARLQHQYRRHSEDEDSLVSSCVALMSKFGGGDADIMLRE
ncbi:hypothetical protein PAMA_008362 [Pampus argenteus]